MRKKTASAVKSLWGKWNALKRDRQFQKLLNYDGIPLWSLLRDRFSLIFSLMLPEAIKHVEVANHIIDVEKPDILVLMDELSSTERATAYVAKLRGIPTLSLQAMAYRTRESPIPISTDKVAVGGELIRQVAIKRKGEDYRERFVITGEPRFEAMMQTLKHFNQEEFRRQLGLEAGRKTILFTSQPIQNPVTAEIRERLIHCVYSAIKQLPDKQFVVKLHPGEGFAPHHQLKQEMKLENVVIIKDVNLYHLLAISDLVMTFFSTTGLEAMLVDRPVIEINLTGKPDELPYVERSAAIGVYREEDLVPAIKAALYNEEVRAKLAQARKNFVYDYAYLQDGQAAKRVVNLIMQMLEDSKKSRIKAKATV